MRFIGKNNKETASSRNSPRLTVYNNNLYITKTALNEFDLRNGDKIKFMNDGSFFAFFKTSPDDISAYSLYVHDPNKGAVIKSRGLVRFFRTEIGRVRGGFSFLLSATRSTVGDSPLIEMKTDKVYVSK